MCSCCEHSNWQQFLGLSNCITDLHPERAWASGQNSLPQDAWHFFLPMCPTSRSTCIFQYMFELPRCPKWVLIITLYRFSYEPPCFIGILHCHVTCLIVSEGISGGFIPHAAGQEARGCWWIDNIYLVGGLEHCLFSPIVGMMIQSDFDIFQRGWNHQPDI